MPGFSQVTCPRAAAAASAPGNRDAGGYDRSVTRRRTKAPADPGTSRRARPITAEARA